MTEIELALERGQRIAPFRGLLFLFWGLILAKCCLAQWAIVTYAIPIDGVVFVWLPSIFFGLVCTVVYARLTLQEFHRAPLTTNLVRGIWLACAVSLGLFASVGVGFGGVAPTLLPAILSVLLGMGYCIHGFLDHRRLFLLCAVGWWIGSGWLFYLNNLDALLWLAAMLIALQVAPTALLYLEGRRQLKANQSRGKSRSTTSSRLA